MCVPWHALPALCVSFQPVSACCISFGFGKWGFFSLAGSTQQPFYFACASWINWAMRGRSMHTEQLGFLKAQFSQLSSTWLALLERRSVIAGPGPMGHLPFLKSSIRALPNGDLQMDAVENEKADWWSTSFHGMGLPFGAEWKCGTEASLEEVWFGRARTHAG